MLEIVTVKVLLLLWGALVVMTPLTSVSLSENLAFAEEYNKEIIGYADYYEMLMNFMN